MTVNLTWRGQPLVVTDDPKFCPFVTAENPIVVLFEGSPRRLNDVIGKQHPYPTILHVPEAVEDAMVCAAKRGQFFTEDEQALLSKALAAGSEEAKSRYIRPASSSLSMQVDSAGSQSQIRSPNKIYISGIPDRVSLNLECISMLNGEEMLVKLELSANDAIQIARSLTEAASTGVA